MQGHDLEDVVPPALISPKHWRREDRVSWTDLTVRRTSSKTDDAVLDGVAQFLLAFAKESAQLELSCREFLRTPGVPKFPFPVSALSALFLRGFTVESLSCAFDTCQNGDDNECPPCPSLRELQLLAFYYRSRHLERDPRADGPAPLSTVYSTFLSHSIAATEYLAGSAAVTVGSSSAGMVTSTADRVVATAKKVARSALEKAASNPMSLPPLADVQVAGKFLRALSQQAKCLQKIDKMKRDLSSAHLAFHVPTLFRRVHEEVAGGFAAASTGIDVEKVQPQIVSAAAIKRFMASRCILILPSELACLFRHRPRVATPFPRDWLENTTTLLSMTETDFGELLLPFVPSAGLR